MIRFPSSRPRRTLARVALVVAAFAVVAVAAGLTLWSPPGGRERTPARLGDGRVTVDETLSATVPMASMPGMGTDVDPVPSGKRRVSVNVRVQAGGTPLRPAPGVFALRGPDGSVVPVHRFGLPGDVPAGMTAAGPLVFQIPVAWRSGTLAVGGGQSIPVTLPPAPSGGGHGSSPSPGASAHEHQGSPGCCHHAD